MKRLGLLSAALILTIISVAIWQHRFEVVPDALPETRLADPLVGWSANSEAQCLIEDEDGKTILRLERSRPDEKYPGVGIWLGPLPALDYIHVRCEARWENVARGPRPYQDARFTITPRTSDGALHYPPEGRLFNGTGTSGWVRKEVAFGLTPDLVDIGVRMGMGGDSGCLEIRNLSLFAVRQRFWVPFAIATTLIGWTWLAAVSIRRRKLKPSWLRTLTAAIMVVGFSWVFIFPQARDHFKPLIGQFSITGLPVLPELADPIVIASSEPVRTLAVEAKKIAPNDDRQQSTLHHLLRNLDRDFNGLHFMLFFTFTLTFMFITGHSAQWPLPLILAILAELIPELAEHLGGWDDLSDLVENLVGVACALLIWVKLPLLKRFHLPEAA